MKLKERIDSLCDRVALELKKSKQSAATADDLNHWKERANLYVQSRGHGLVTNGSGLMRDNTK